MKRLIGSTQNHCRDEHLNPQLHRRRAARVCGLGPYWGSPCQQGHDQAAVSAQVGPPGKEADEAQDLSGDADIAGLGHSGEERPRRLSQLPALSSYPGKSRRGHRLFLQLDIESTRDTNPSCTKGKTVLLIIFPGESTLLFDNFLEIPVMSEKMQMKTMKVFYSLTHRIEHIETNFLNLRKWT